jgi:hypothetical protein
MGVRGNSLVHALPSNVGHLLGNVTHARGLVTSINIRSFRLIVN